MEAAELKKDGRVQKVVVTGCLAQRYSIELAGELLMRPAFLQL
jgi:ribosomal protein S12 methylthiotransferase